MRYKSYFERILETGEVRELSFGPEQFKTMGLLPVSIGMPELEALQLINRWNRTQQQVRFLYWLGDEK